MFVERPPAGFTLQAQDPETGDTDDSAVRVEIGANVRLVPSQEASIGRQPQITDADGREVIGIFSNGELLTLRAGDHVALFDNGVAVVDTITI
jgi:hypothetical protein